MSEVCCSAAEGAQRGCQSGPCFFQFGLMGQREPVQDPLALRRQMHQHLAGVLRIRLPGHEPQALKPVNKTDSTLMFKEQALGQMPYRWQGTGRSPLQNQQSLVLLRLKPCGRHHVLTEVKKPANLKPELLQLSILRVDHRYI